MRGIALKSRPIVGRILSRLGDFTSERVRLFRLVHTEVQSVIERGATLERFPRFSSNRHLPTKSSRSLASGAATITTHATMGTNRHVTEVNDLVAPKDEVTRFIAECMMRAGTTDEDAATVAHHLMIADYRGHLSHGMNRMQMYVNDIKTRLTDPAAKPQIVNDFQAVALVDGKNALGQVVGKYCMELAIGKAKNFGIGMVSARGSNHYGLCGYYTMMAMKENLVGFSCTNTSPLMAPTRSRKAALGTNPLSLGMAAVRESDDFVLDMATTAVALGKIELAVRKEQDIPEGWALGCDGKPTTSASEAMKTSTLMPLGGAENTSGYKGFGLAMMVEILCGIVSGSNYGPNIRSWKAGNEIANLGHCFIAINPEAFACGAKERLGHLVQQIRDLPPADNQPVLVPGDHERICMDRVDREGGITYHLNQINSCIDVANELCVEPMKLVCKKA